jgi:hypothetical protein
MRTRMRRHECRRSILAAKKTARMAMTGLAYETWLLQIKLREPYGEVQCLSVYRRDKTSSADHTHKPLILTQVEINSRIGTLYQQFSLPGRPE